jgi:hypothetical protein
MSQSDETTVISNTGVSEKERTTKLAIAVTISLATEIINATIGKSMPNRIDVSDVPKIAANAINSNLLS